MKLFSVTFLLASAVLLQAQDSTLIEARPRLRLEHADRMVIEGESRQEVYHVIGNVLLIQGEASMRCEEAYFNSQLQTAVLKRSVHIVDGDRWLKADDVDYNGRDRIETARGHVVLGFGHQELSAHEVEYKQTLKQATARGNVLMQDFIEQAELTGHEAFYDRKIEYGRVTGQPVLTRLDSASTDTLFVEGLVMEGYGRENKVVITDSVRIRQGGLKATCQKASYWAETERMLMLDMPIVWQDLQELKADTIDVTMVESQLHSGRLVGKAAIVSHDSSNTGEMTGREILIQSTSDSTRTVWIHDQATSTYQVTEKDGTPGESVFTGDRIKIYFKRKKAIRLTVTSDPGKSTGKFQPEKKVKTEVQADTSRSTSN